MKKKIELAVFVQKKKLFTTSEIIANGVNVKHRSIVRLIIKHTDRLLKFGELRCDLKSQLKVYTLSEEQTMFLMTLLKNTEIVLDFKEHLTKQFFAMRKIIQRQNNLEWKELRTLGKIDRKVSTDEIKEFVDYATKQGSKSASKYYIHLANAENKALFFMEQKFKNLREILDRIQLDQLKMADNIIAKTLKEGMDKQMYYKDIYVLVKDKLIIFADLVGKSIVPRV